jgi:hypothetical protein
MRFVGKGAGVGALLGIVVVAVLLSVASLRHAAAPEARAESVGGFAFLAAAPLSLVSDVLREKMESEVGAGAVMLVAVPMNWALIGAVVGAIIWLREARTVATVNGWPRKRI